MISSNVAVWIMCAFALILVVILPVLNSIKKLSDFISFRWSCIAIILLIMVGVVIDFEQLSDNTRDIVLCGGLIIVGIYLALRTIEKILYNGWLKGVNLKAEASKGDIKGSITLSNEEKSEDKKNASEEKKEEDASLEDENE